MTRAADDLLAGGAERRDMPGADIACFLDFDHTLFNTDEFFHVDLRHSLRHFGIDCVSWEQGYTRAWRAGYTLERHLEEIRRQSGRLPALDEVRRVIRDSFSDLQRYVFPDVLPFLENARQEGVALYLLSFGDLEWQRHKVLGSRIDHYFDEMFFTTKQGGKAQVILERARGFKRVLMIDNNPSELDLIKDVAPAVTTYCINRVPEDMVIPHDELSRSKFFDARDYLDKAWRHEHVPCRTVNAVLSS